MKDLEKRMIQLKKKQMANKSLEEYIEYFRKMAPPKKEQMKHMARMLYDRTYDLEHIKLLARPIDGTEVNASQRLANIEEYINKHLALYSSLLHKK